MKTKWSLQMGPKRSRLMNIALGILLIVVFIVGNVVWPSPPVASSPLEPLRVVSCADPSFHTHSAFNIVLSKFLHTTYVHFSEYTSTSSSLVQVMPKDDAKPQWNVWSTCSTNAADRVPPVFLSASRDFSTVFFLPGKCAFAGKAGLWEGLVKALGLQLASEVAPRTFIHPLENKALESYLTSLSTPTEFVGKSGHRQRSILSLSFDPIQPMTSFIAQVQHLNPTVLQIKVSSRLFHGEYSTAFRTYTWVECKSATVSQAIVDWNSPSYVSPNASQFVASGYTPTNVELSTHELLLELFNDDLPVIKSSVTTKVGYFLKAFTRIMCASPEPSFWEKQQQSKTRIMELFAFDWVPTVNGEAMLLEVNRFPDMSVKNAAQLMNRQHKKDWLKVCTYARRFEENMFVDDAIRKECQANQRDSFVFMKD